MCEKYCNKRIQLMSHELCLYRLLIGTVGVSRNISFEWFRIYFFKPHGVKSLSCMRDEVVMHTSRSLSQYAVSGNSFVRWGDICEKYCVKIHWIADFKNNFSLEISCTVLTSKIKILLYPNLQVSAILLENLCTHDLYCEIMFIKILVIITFAYVENQWVYKKWTSWRMR